MDDTTAWLPEPNTILLSGSGKEVVDLLVCVLGLLQVPGTANLCLNQVVTVDGRGDRHSRQATANELQHGHLHAGAGCAP